MGSAGVFIVALIGSIIGAATVIVLGAYILSFFFSLMVNKWGRLSFGAQIMLGIEDPSTVTGYYDDMNEKSALSTVSKVEHPLLPHGFLDKMVQRDIEAIKANRNTGHYYRNTGFDEERIEMMFELYPEFRSITDAEWNEIYSHYDRRLTLGLMNRGMETDSDSENDKQEKSVTDRADI